jgi:hypothetical protein
MAQSHSTVQVAPAMRWLLVGAVALVVLAGIPLFFFSASTEQFLAWTIQPRKSGHGLGWYCMRCSCSRSLPLWGTLHYDLDKPASQGAD